MGEVRIIRVCNAPGSGLQIRGKLHSVARKRYEEAK